MKIKIPDMAAIIPQYLLITIKGGHFGDPLDGGEIGEIEIYADPEYKTCLAQEITMKQLPASSCMSIHAAIDEFRWTHERTKRELADIMDNRL